MEKTGTIGGKMATFDKTFPTLDCAACILTPKMVEVNQNPNITLMTYCEVKGTHGRSRELSRNGPQKGQEGQLPPVLDAEPVQKNALPRRPVNSMQEPP